MKTSSNQNWVRGLNIAAAVGLTVGGASVLPYCNLPKSVLFYGLLLASICKTVAGELVQIKGVSDEAQGIAPTKKL